MIVTDKDLNEFNTAAHRVVDVITLSEEVGNEYVVYVSRQEMKSIAKVTGQYGTLFGKTLEIGELQTPESIQQEKEEGLRRNKLAEPILEFILDENTRHDINHVPKADIDTRTVCLSEEDYDLISDSIMDWDGEKRLYGMRVTRQEKVAA